MLVPKENVTALEDAYIISSLLGAVEGKDENEKAFDAFDRARRPRTQKLVATSRKSGRVRGSAITLMAFDKSVDKIRKDMGKAPRG